MSSETSIEKAVNDYATKKYDTFNTVFDKVSKSYSSIAKLITLNGMKNGKSTVEHLFAKTLTNSKARNDRLKLDVKFRREVIIYQEILKEFQQIQKVLPDEEILPITKCIEATSNYIILENLKFQNYLDVSDQKTLNLDEMKIMMKYLAKYHGLSFVMKHQDLEKFTNLAGRLDDIFVPDNNRRQKLIETTWNYMVSALKDENLKLKLLSVRESLLNIAINKMIGTPENGVICHGDFDLRNVLFKYNETGTPTSMIMIDYQLSYYASPVFDLLFTMASSISSQTRDHHYENLLTIYYESLEDFLKLFKLNINEIYSREEFNKDLHKYFPYVFAKNLVTLRVICSPQKSDDEMNEIYENPQGTGSIFIYNSDTAEVEYSNKINGLMRHYVDKKYIS